jgi:hypothetical protein
MTSSGDPPLGWDVQYTMNSIASSGRAWLITGIRLVSVELWLGLSGAGGGHGGGL